MSVHSLVPLWATAVTLNIPALLEEETLDPKRTLYIRVCRDGHGSEQLAGLIGQGVHGLGSGCLRATRGPGYIALLSIIKGYYPTGWALKPTGSRVQSVTGQGLGWVADTWGSTRVNP